MRFRITVSGGRDTELRGYLGADDDVVTAQVQLQAFALAMKPYGLVIASVAEDDYNPFQEEKT